MVNEFSDLMITASKKIEDLIARLAQKAPSNYYLFSNNNQRQSIDIIAALIKVNIIT